MTVKRDEFTQKIKVTLAKRASYICSNPDCHCITVAPSLGNSGFTYIGKAAHITAAAPGGPRFDESLTSEQRKSIENGIFLCSPCSEIIDYNNGIDFTVEDLKRWKEHHESWVRKNLNKSVSALVGEKNKPFLNLCFDNKTQYLEITKTKKAKSDDSGIKKDLANKIVRLDFQINNQGNSPATDIHIFLNFPEDFYIVNEKNLHSIWDYYPLNIIDNTGAFIKKRFTKPAVNSLKERLTNAISDTLGFSIFQDEIAEHREEILNLPSKEVSASIDDSNIKFHIPKLKHNLTQTLESLYIRFHSEKKMKSFKVKYKLNADEMPFDVEGIFDVKIIKQ